MEKVKETTVALLVAYIFISVLIVLYNLLMWQILPKVLSYTVLAALVLLKGAVISLQISQPVQDLNPHDKSKLKSTVLVILFVFFIILFISYLYRGEQLASLISLITVLLTAAG
jgi:hypothetical protein